VGIRLASSLSRNRVLRGSGCCLLVILLLVLTAVPGAISQTTPYSVNDVEKLAKEGIEEHAFLESVKQHGIGFEPTVEMIEELKANHVPESVLKEIWVHIPQGQSPDFYLREGDRLLATGYYAEAIGCYQRILVQLPDDPVAKARIEQTTEQRKKAEAEAQLRAAQDNERPYLSYYRKQLDAFLEKPDCDGAFYYAHKILYVGPDQSAKAAYEKACGSYSLTLKNGTPVTLEFQRDLKGSDEHSGEKIDFKVVDPIVVNGLLVVPKGGTAWGTVEKSEGGRKLSRVGQLRITIEGMWLADGEKCPLGAVEDYRGTKKTKKKKIGILIGSLFTAGIPLIVEANAEGKDVLVAKGAKASVAVAVTMSLDPVRFELSGPAPKSNGIAAPAIVSGLSFTSPQNQGGNGVSPTSQPPPAQASRPDVEQVAKASSSLVATTRKVVPGQGRAPVILFEERHDLRAVQVQEAIAMIRMHDQFGLRDIALEGYLKDMKPVDTSWVAHISASQGANVRAKVVVSLLREGEISSAEFMKLLYDDVQLHALENRNEYDVSISSKGENAPEDYLLTIAERSMTAKQGAQVEALLRQLKRLPKTSAEAEQTRKRVLETILSADPWAKEKYKAVEESAKSQTASAEDLLALAEEIENRARLRSVEMSVEDQASMREYKAFWQGRIAASHTMTDGISGLARNQSVALVSAPIGAFHTTGMSALLQKEGVPFAVLRALAMEDPEHAGPLGPGFENKYKAESVFDSGSARYFQQAYPSKTLPKHGKKPVPILEEEWFQAKSETYFLTDRIANQVLSGGAGGNPPGGGDVPPGSAAPLSSGPPRSGGVPWGFSNDDLKGKRVSVDPKRIGIVPAAPGSKRRAVLFPIVLNQDDPAQRKELWIKAILGKDTGDRETVELLLLDALREIQQERPGKEHKKAEDAHGQIQITEDVHAVISETRKGALSVSLGM
jgi:polyhydroxyalkanoate synthesis regulator phasin